MFCNLFSHIEWYSVCYVCLHTTLKQPGNMIMWTWELGPYGKSNIFHRWKLDYCNLKSAGKAHWFTFLLITTALIKFLSFLKVMGSFLFLAGKPHGMVECVLEVSCTAMKLKRNMLLWIWELWLDGKKKYFPHWKLDSCSIKLARKTHGFIFLSMTTAALVMILSFLK